MECQNTTTSIPSSLDNKINALLRLCRVCLGKTDANFISIHSVYSWSVTENRSTESMIENLLKVKMTSEKQQPQRICSKCFNKVRLIYAFRNQCHETNIKLMEFHKQIENRSNTQQLRVEGEFGEIDAGCEIIPKVPNNSHVVSQSAYVQKDIQKNISVEDSSNNGIESAALDQHYISDSDDSYEVISNTNESKQRTKKPEENCDRLNAQKSLNVTKTPTFEVIENPPNLTDESSDPYEDIKRKRRKRKDDDVVNCSTFTELCALCGLQFENSTEYIRHMRTKHEEGGNEKKFKCQYCEKSFTQKAGRNLHHNLHTQEEKFICDLCGKVFLTKISIKLHFKYHFGIKKHACTECGYRFVTPREVRDHIKKKHSAKSIACTYSNCTATFSSEYHLNIHLRVHDTNHAFVCDICGVATVNKYRLMEHKRIHTGVNKSKCPICLKVFARQRNVVRHIKTRHKDHKF